MTPHRNSDRLPGHWVPTAFAVLGAVFLALCLAAALMPVRIPIGLGGHTRCLPVGHYDASVEADCASHVHGRLVWAAVSGAAAGVCGLLAFGIQLQTRKELDRVA